MSKINLNENLCIYDYRNPMHEFLFGQDEDAPKKPLKCSCDNCFYGRTQLAEYCLILLSKIS